MELTIMDECCDSRGRRQPNINPGPFFTWGLERPWEPGDPIYRHPTNMNDSQYVRPIFQLFPAHRFPHGNSMRWCNTPFAWFDFGQFDKPEPGPWKWLQAGDS